MFMLFKFPNRRVTADFTFTPTQWKTLPLPHLCNVGQWQIAFCTYVSQHSLVFDNVYIFNNSSVLFVSRSAICLSTLQTYTTGKDQALRLNEPTVYLIWGFFSVWYPKQFIEYQLVWNDKLLLPLPLCEILDIAWITCNVKAFISLFSHRFSI